MTNRTKWLMLITLTSIFCFVVWKLNGPAIARAMDIDTSAIKLPQIPLLNPEPPAPEITINWLDDIDTAIATCRQTGKTVLIFFTTKGDPACDNLNDNALLTETVASFLADRFVAVKIENNSENSATARKFGIYTVPALVVYGPDGKHADTLVGLPDVPEEGLLETEVYNWLKIAFAKSWGI